MARNWSRPKTNRWPYPAIYRYHKATIPVSLKLRKGEAQSKKRSLLGLLFPSFTTLMYVAVAPGGVPGWDWLGPSGQAKASDNQLTNQAKK